MLIKNGTIITPQGKIKSSMLIKDRKIISISDDIQVDKSEEIIDANGKYIFPGFIDLHVHGGNGVDVCDEQADIMSYCSFHAQHGTTSLLLTVRTMTKPNIEKALVSLKNFINTASDTKHLNVLGIHLEGPFINQDYKGALKSENIQPPSTQVMETWNNISGNNIKLVTLAPELQGAEEVINYLNESGIVTSAGHTGATYSEAMESINWGVRHITHCFNGMKGFHHREPGILGAALLSDQVTTELILDTYHSHPAAAKLLVNYKGPEKVVLITDSSRASGMEDGEYTFEDRNIIVENGIVRIPEGNLAGSTLTMNKAVKNAIQLLDVSHEDAAQMACLTPATVLGIDNRKGSLEIGKDADIAILDSEFEVDYSICEGEVIYKK